MAKARAAAQCRESCGPSVPRFSRASAPLRPPARGLRPPAGGPGGLHAEVEAGPDRRAPSESGINTPRRGALPAFREDHLDRVDSRD